MNRLAPLCISTLLFLCASAVPAISQTSYAEVEPNSSKAQATVVPPLVAGDVLTGQSDPFFDGTSDVFRVKTAAAPIGVYRHRLTFSASSGPLQAGAHILGQAQALNPGGGGALTTVDAVVQSNQAAWKSSWYGFGRSEQIYLQVPPLGTVRIPYTLTLSSVPVSVTPIPQTFEPGPIAITTINTSTEDTSIHVYRLTISGVFAEIGYANDDETLNSSSTQSYLLRDYLPGTYYVAMSGGGTAWRQVAQPDEHLTAQNISSRNIPDFFDVLVRPAGPTTAQVWDFRIMAKNGVYLQSAVLPANPTEEILWFSFTVAPNAPVIDDLCANATPIFAGETYSGTFAAATNDSGSACDSGGPTSKDVWFKYTNTTPSDIAFRVNTCGSLANTTLSIQAACGGAELACSDDCLDPACGMTTSCASVLMTSGQTVFVRVSDKGLGGPDYVLNTSIELSNDECTAPKVLAGAGDHPIDNAFASTSAAGQTQSACNFAGGTGITRDLWYSYTPLIGGSVQITTCGLVGGGPSDDSKIAVYAGTACPTPGSAVACSDTTLPSCGGVSTNPATATFNAVCGTTYLIQIGMSPLATASLRGSFRIQEFGPAYGAWCYTPTTTFCTGDIAGSCPTSCGLLGGTGRGCPNSANPLGAGLSAAGVASVSPGLDSLVLTASGITGPAQFIQASTSGSTMFNDGRLCAVGGIIRLGVAFPSAGNASFPSGPGSSIYTIGGPFPAGSTRYYQCWYRDAAPFCTSATHNLTSAIQLTWYP